MLTFLDLLVYVFITITAVSILALCLMFFIKKPIVRKLSFYLVVLLGIYMSYVSFRIGGFDFPIQTFFTFFVFIASVGSFILERISNGNEKKFLYARSLVAVALVVGIFNAFIF